VLPLALKLIGKAPDAATQQLVAILGRWAAAGAHRRDLDKDGVDDDSAAVALMDAWWPRLVPAMFRPVIGAAAFDRTVGLLHLDDYPAIDAEAYYDGWYGQVARDLSDALGVPSRGRFSRIYCGNGSRARCRTMLLRTLTAAAAAVAKAQANADPAAWRVPATCPIPAGGPPPCDEIVFTATGAVDTPPVPWQNRPTYQQIVELAGP
jgi:hypothetical protein